MTEGNRVAEIEVPLNGAGGGGATAVMVALIEEAARHGERLEKSAVEYLYTDGGTLNRVKLTLTFAMRRVQSA